MTNRLQDTIKMGEGLLTVALKCAQCGVPVPSNQPHTCKKETPDVSDPNAQSPPDGPDRPPA